MISVRQAHNGHLLGSSAVVLRDEVVKAFMVIVADSQSVSSCCGAVNVVVQRCSQCSIQPLLKGYQVYVCFLMHCIGSVVLGSILFTFFMSEWVTWWCKGW